LKVTFRSIGHTLVTLAGSLIIVLALALGLFRMAVPELPQYKPQIEAWVSKALGSPLRVGAIDARLSLGGPQVLLNDAEVLTADGSSPVLTAESVIIVLSPLQMITRRQIGIKRLLFDGVGLVVEHSAEGGFSVLGKTAGGSGRTEVPLDALPEGRLHIRNAHIDIIDHASDAKDLRFTEVRLDVERKGPRIEIISRFELPEELGGSGHYTLERLSDAGPEDIELRMVLGLEDVHLDAWAEFAPPDLPLIREGDGNISLFVSTRGPQITSVSADFDLRGVGSPVAAAAPTQTIYDVMLGHIEWNKNPTGWQFSAEDLQITRNGKSWPAGDIRFERVDRDEGAVYYADADFLRLEDLVPFEPLLPRGGPEYHLRERNVRGDILGLNVSYLAGGADNYSVKATIRDAGIDSFDDQPGVRGMSAELAAQNAGGRLLLQGLESVALPAMFREPIDLDEGSINLAWTRSPQGIEIRGENIRVANPDLALAGQMNMSLPDGDASPYLDLKLDILRFDAATKNRYLPVALLKENLLNWLDGSIVGGQVSRGTAIWRGALSEFPFDNGGGEFRVGFLVEECTLKYANGWPQAENLRAEIVFENAGMDATILGGSIAGNEVPEGSAKIPDFRNPILSLTARTGGKLPRLLGFAYDSPLIDRFGFLRDLNVSGDGRVGLDMTMPLRERERTAVRVSLGLDDADIAHNGFAHGFQGLSGDVLLAEGGVQADDVIGMFLGKPVRVDLETDRRGSGDPVTLMIVNSWGDATSIGKIVPYLEPRIDGETDWHAVVRFPSKNSADPMTITLRSVLGGLALDLPEPFAKTAVDVRNFEFSLGMFASGRRDWALQLDDIVSGKLRYVGGLDNRTRGSLVFGGTQAQLPEEPGIVVSGSLARTRLESWLDLRGGGESAFALQDILRSVSVDVEDFIVFGLLLGQSRVELVPSPAGWVADIESENVAGLVTVPYQLADGSPLDLQMQRLRLIDWETAEETAEPTDPAVLPAIKVQADDFVLLDKNLGSLQARLEKTRGGLFVRQFDTRSESLTMRSIGSWLRSPDGSVTKFEGSLTSTDLGTSLSALGYPGYIEEGRGNSTFNLSWSGGPDRDFVKTIGGRIYIQLKDGVLQDVDPGAGRALGLLSITALPRRLSLDFSDVFGKGLSFDKIEGDFTLVDGNAYTSNLIMDGPAAGVGISGRVGIAAEDYDQTAIVHAKVGSLAPIVGTVLGGPPLGIGLWIFSEVFKEPLKGIARAQYSITGSWSAPVVERRAFSPAAGETGSQTELASGNEG
jgi:uncharacterized protein (TIGR02099 family)